MLGKTDSNATWFVVAALGLFFIGGLLTTVAPPLVDKSWNKPFDNHDPAKGLTGELKPLHGAGDARIPHLHPRRLQVLPHAADSHPGGRHHPLRLEGRALAHFDAGRVRLRLSPDIRHQAHRAGSFARRRQVQHAMARAHFRNPRDLVPGSIMPPFPWIANNQQDLEDLVAYLQTRGRAKDWRPDNDYEK